jgi:hypothetical protein
MAPLMQPLASAGAAAPITAPNARKMAKIFILDLLELTKAICAVLFPQPPRNFVVSSTIEEHLGPVRRFAHQGRTTGLSRENISA